MNYFFDVEALTTYIPRLNETKDYVFIQPSVLEKSNTTVLRFLKDNMNRVRIEIFSDMECTSPNSIKALGDYILRLFKEGLIEKALIGNLSHFVMLQYYYPTLQIEYVPKELPSIEYKGYKTVYLSDAELAAIYNNSCENTYGLLTNEYLLCYNKSNSEYIASFFWSGENYVPICTTPYEDFNTRMFGQIKPKDEFQQITMHSMSKNRITVVKGPAGSGKSFLALSYLIGQLEHNRIDKIIIFCNTVAAADSAKLGFYPGDRLSKLLDSQIGNFLNSKLGSPIMVEKWIQEDKLVLLPMSDIRGYDTTGMRAGIYVTEAQNTNDTLMRLVLTRIGEDCICILDGDDREQVDVQNYSGKKNGLKRVSEVFRGDSCYGEVTLSNIYRSHIAELASKI